MTYSELITALKATGIPFAEGAWVDAHKLQSDYGVYALDGSHDLESDNLHTESMLEGTIDLYTYHSNGLQQADLVKGALESIGAIWRENYAGYEADTGYTHREWVFNVARG